LETPEIHTEAFEAAANSPKQPVRTPYVSEVWRLRLPLQVIHVDADDWHGQDEPGQRADEAHEELREVFIREFLIGNQSFGVNWDLLDLRDVLMLMGPDLDGVRVLLMYHAHAFEASRLDLQGGELLLESVDESLAICGLAGSLEVVDVCAQDERQSLGRLFSSGLGRSCNPARAVSFVPHVELGSRTATE